MSLILPFCAITVNLLSTLPSVVVVVASVSSPLSGVTVTVVVDALYVEGTGYTVNGRAIRIGSAYTLRFPGYVGNGVCIHLTEVGNAT